MRAFIWMNGRMLPWDLAQVHISWCFEGLRDPSKQVHVVLRTSLPATLLEPQIRHEIQSIDPSLPVFNVVSMNDILDRSLAARRFSADLVGGFAGLAVLLASIGIYGLLAYMVGQRSRHNKAGG